MIFNYIMQQRCAGGVFVIHLSRQVKRMEHIRISALSLSSLWASYMIRTPFSQVQNNTRKPLLSILYYAPANSIKSGQRQPLNPESSQSVIVLHFFSFGQFLPIFKIATPAKIVVTTIHGACPAAAKFEIVDGFALNNISALSASDCIPDNSCHTHFLSNTVLCEPICKNALPLGRAFNSSQLYCQG